MLILSYEHDPIHPDHIYSILPSMQFESYAIFKVKFYIHIN